MVGYSAAPPSLLSKLRWVPISFWPGVTSLNELSEKYVFVSGPCATSRCPVPSSHSSPRSLLPRTWRTLAGEWMKFSKFLNAHTFLIYSTIGPAGSPALSWFVIPLDIANKSVFIFSRAAWNSLLGLRWGLRLPNICVTCFLNSKWIWGKSLTILRCVTGFPGTFLRSYNWYFLMVS